jgi:hypothetical protein
MGSFGGDEDGDGVDESMDGVMYNEPDAMEDDQGNERRPAIRRQAPSGDDTGDDGDNDSRFPSTYRPIQGRPPGGIASGYFPPRADFTQPNQAPTNSSAPPVQYPPLSNSASNARPAAAVFAQHPMTESPKPLSPGHVQRGSISTNNDTRNRSPSMTQFQQHQYHRGSISNLNLPAGAPQLPPPHSLNPPDSRYTLPSQAGPAHPPTQPSGPPTHMGGNGPLSSHSNSLSSHGHSGHGSGEPGHPMFGKEERIWAYIQSLEQRVNSMQEEISTLRQQVAQQSQRARTS